MNLKSLIHSNGGNLFGDRNFTTAIETILGSRPHTAHIDHPEGETEDYVVIQYKNKNEGAYVISRVKNTVSGVIQFAVKICKSKDVTEGNPNFHPWQYIAASSTSVHFRRFLTAVDKVHLELKAITEHENQLYKELQKAK